jgi:protein gp37
MGYESGIEWTMATWNPLLGCTKYSDGCKNCYAERIALQFQRRGVRNYEDGFKLKLLPERLDMPLHWKKTKMIFVDSMCDLFHDGVPLEYIKRIFGVMKQADWHMFQILTKRSQRLLELAPHLEWHPNIMMGVTIESDKYRSRLDDLKQTAAKMKFLSIEPLIAPVEKLDLYGIDWVIVGGESGPDARPMSEAWVRDIRDWTIEQGKAFWYKQASEHGGTKRTAMLDEKYYKEFPKFKIGNDLFG